MARAAHGREKAANLVMTEEMTKQPMRAEKAQEKKEPIYQAPGHEAAEDVAAKQLEGGGATGIKSKWGSSSTES
jgi:hypothetical protein